jgi:outer membrane protein assembly factor BamC
MRSLNRFSCAALALATLAGCSTVDSFISGDKVDYRSQASKTPSLEIPPDLTQLARDTRYQPQAGSVSATVYQGAAAAPAGQTTVPSVAPQSMGEIRVLRDGKQRWLVVPMTPEQLWPQLKSFWQERGFALASEDIQTGMMETDWAENRAKLPDDIIRRTLGRVIESLYSTGERDKFRTRVERTPEGAEVFISHRGMEEVYVGQQKDQTMWAGRPNDPQLEAEFLQRLMAKLGTREEAARTAVANAAPSGAPARARLMSDGTAALQVDEGFERAWRRVGLALDRSGFTVEDRDRTNGLYYVRYIDPKNIGREEPGFFSKLFGLDKDDKVNLTGPGRYRIAVKGQGDNATLVSVLSSQGTPENSDVGQSIVTRLVDDLK